MLRAISALVLALFLAGPGIRAQCLWLCAGTDRPSTAISTCHEEPGAGATIAQLHSCATTSPALAMAFKPAGADTTVSLAAPPPASTVLDRYSMPDGTLHGPPGSPPYCPPLLIPLRI